MKRLTILALLLVAMTTGAAAHEGSIGLYTDLPGTDCDATWLNYETYDIYVMYFKSDAGPDGIFAAQFKVEPPAAGAFIQSFEPSPDVTVTVGDIAGAGISCSYGACSGGGQDILLIGTMSVFVTVETPLQFMVVASTDINPTDPPIAPRVAICDEAHTIVAVLGGWYSTPDGSCDTGTEEKSWGAIKDMYKN